MRKLFLAFLVLIGMVFSSQSFALTGGTSSNKTEFQQPLVSAVANGNTAFVTGTSLNSGVAQFCATSPGVSGGNFQGVLLSCPGAAITGLNLSGGTSGGNIIIYDANTNLTNQNFASEVGPQEVVYEATIGANTTTFVDLHDAPINTINGVVAQASSTSGVVVYSSTGLSANH